MDTITLEVEAGESINNAAKRAVSLAKHSDSYVEFKFNGLSVTAHPKSFSDDLVTIYVLNSTIRRLKAGYNDND